MDSFEVSQAQIEHTINKSFENFKKKGLAKMTKGATQIQMQRLEKVFEKYEKAHEDMEESEEADANHAYFKNAKYDDVCQLYMERMGEFQEHLNNFDGAPRSSSRTLNLTANQSHSDDVKLPPMDLPKFAGDYLNWTSFESLFRSAVSSRENLADIVKLQYLRSSVEGEAADLIKDVPIVDGNFTVAWNMLSDQFNNQRRVVTLLIESMFSVKPMASESSSEVKRVIKGINSPLSTLKTLARPTNTWSDLLVFLTVSKLDSVTKKEWETSLGRSTEPPAFDKLVDFLQTKQVALESFESNERNKRGKGFSSNPPPNSQLGKSHPPSKAFATDVGNTSKVPKCVCCTKAHNLLNCPKFLAKPVGERHALVKRSRLCYNCLKKHLIGACSVQTVCSKCNGRHHDLLHFDGTNSRENPSQVPQNSGVEQTSGSSTAHLVRLTQANPETVLLATAWICIENGVGEKITARALVDQCAQSSFISESLCQRLKLPRKAISLPVNGLGSKRQIVCKSVTEFVIKPHFQSTFSCQVVAYVIPKVSSYHPITKNQESSWEHLQKLTLADPHYHRTGVIDVLLGATVHARIVEGQLIKGLEHEPIATRTQLGWIISGATSSGEQQFSITPTVLHCSAEPEVNDLLQKFWLQEELRPVRLTTPDEEACERYFVDTHKRTPDGRYQVRLPFKSSNIQSLGDTYQAAVKLLKRMEARFEKDEAFKNAYHAFMREYLDLGHMSLVSDSSDNPLDLDDCCFLPHHGVFKESSSTTKLRTVFNGSMKTRRGFSLNDCLHIGANLLPDLAQLVSAWRNYKYAFVSDIEKMFRQILIHADDQRWQLIPWRFDSSEPIQSYRLHTVTYGIGSSPFLANRTMKQLAEDEKEKFPLGSVILRDEIYMDDVLSGSHCLKEARVKQAEVLELCKVGGFSLRKWLANDTSLLSCLPDALLAAEPSELAESESCFAILGLKWQPIKDHFQFTVKVDEEIDVWTKRLVLSKIAKLFDPLGLLAPTVIFGKIFLQQLWLLNLEWDECLPSDKAKQWTQWYGQLSSIADLRIPRWSGFMPSSRSLQIHGFADASKAAYGAVVYLRTVTSSSVTISLIQAKSKVAPLKTLSIPRLELSAAHLLAKLVHRILPLFSESKPQVYLWSDSLDVLHWLREIPSKWPTFISNRCADIHNLVPDSHWSHVRSEHNPADYVSRGVMPSDLIDLRTWWSGPTWLIDEQSSWPTTLLEVRSEFRQSSASPESPDAVVCAAVVDKIVEPSSKGIWQLVYNCSSWYRLVRVTAYVLRFVDRLRSKRFCRSTLFDQKWYSIALEYSDISVSELDRSRYVLIYVAQQFHFAKEIRSKTLGRSLLKSSLLYSLDPILDEGLLFVGGRLKHSLLSLDEKHPLILPSESRLSKLIVRDCHARSLHGGVQLTLSTLRRQFWIIRGRQKVKSIIKDCHTCIRYRASEQYQKMGDLPKVRVQPARPFSHVGVDYAGPIRVRAAPGRGHISYKGYICIFICLSTKAIHLEIVSDLTSKAFLAAFRRFTARRGPCKMLWSDRGTNFVGADKELRDLYVQASDHIRELRSVLCKEGTEWRFNPPAAPHFGGIWEAAVKSTKYHLRRVVGEAKLTYEEFATLLCQIESCLNSRPLTPLSDDPSDFQPLTPAHFLIQAPSYIVPEPDYTAEKIPVSRRWQILQQMMQGFWQRWSQEYLQSLQRRQKWQNSSQPFKEGDLAILRDEDTPPAQWPMARIVASHPGPDGLVRVVTVRTANSTFDRPIVKLIRLPTEEDENEDAN